MIYLIDADSTIPNIALMKLSSYYKSIGEEVKLFIVNLPYYPNRKKIKFIVPPGADKVYCSVVFQGNKEYIVGDNIIFGGTGVDYTIALEEHIDNQPLDYTIYPDNNISYGFITRGCIRNCSFCVVPKKEGGIKLVDTIDNIVKHKQVKFLDNNILAYPKHKEVLEELISKKIKHQFNQGLDIRLLDEENSKLLSKLNYTGEYIFAFDNWNLLNLIDRKIELLDWRKPYQLKFFTYIHPDMPLSDTINRIEYMRKENILPYIMRDISCWSSEYNSFYIDLASYCNQPNIFKKMSWEEFLHKRHTKESRIKESLRLYNTKA